MLIKKCCRCTLDKPITEFHKAKRGFYGVHSICKKCKSIYMKLYAESGKLAVSKKKYKATEKGSATIKAYTKSDKNKEIQKNYRIGIGKKTCVAKLAKYRATQKKAMPKWVDTSALKLIYNQCPNDFEVDHIIPLQGEDVSGLHVPWNMQYLTREQNALKSNSFDGTYSNESWRK